MAYEQPCFKFSATSLVDMRTNQFHFVNIAADDTVTLCSALTDIPCGILQNTPNVGETAEVLAIGISKLRTGAGAALAAGNLVGTDALGEGVTVDPDGAADNYYAGQVLAGSNASEICTVLINCINPVIQSGS